jgi:hypothetical protein
MRNKDEKREHEVMEKWYATVKYIHALNKPLPEEWQNAEEHYYYIRNGLNDHEGRVKNLKSDLKSFVERMNGLVEGGFE